jgi:UDP:flavonoid glycosyltransferase YjiC (YdhE family)
VNPKVHYVRDVLTDPGWKDRARKMREQFDSQDPAEAAAVVIESAGSRAGG